MNNNWNVNNRDRKGYGGQRGRGRGKGARGSWNKNEKFRDQQTPYRNENRGFRGGRGQFGMNKNPSRETPGKRLSEAEIGVTEYMSDHKGFNGIIKCRYSDFQVSEINESGEVAKLTDMSPPDSPEEEAVEEDEDLLLSKYNLEILPMETWDRINSLIVNPPTDENVEVDVTGMSKEDRTKIHDAVKKAFGACLVSSTITINDKKIVRFEKFQKGVRRDNRVKWVWPGEYVHFIVHKENYDTMEAAIKIADRLQFNVKPSMLGYAGTKDRRAKTSQWFSLRKVDPKRIVAACKDVRQLYVGNFTFKNYNLRLGMLKGNRFRIALRNVTASDEVIDAACERLRAHGFINYYGLQRFGTRAHMPTYEVGRKLLQSNFREAVICILQDGDGERIAGRPPPGEVRMQRALANNPRDLVGALDQLPRNQRMMYLHSYQSLVWNQCVSRRLQLLGHAPAPGDLVPLHTLPLDEVEEDISDDEKDGKVITDKIKKSVQSTENNSVQATENNSVQATENNSVQDTENNSTQASENNSTQASENNSVQDTENNSAQATENNSVQDTENNSVQDTENNSAQSTESNSVHATENNSVQATENNSVQATENNSLPATENNSVQATENNSLPATENNSAQATENKVENKVTSKEQDKNAPKPKIPVKILTEEDVASGRYTIFDIVMPVPGYNIEYPPNMKEYYKELVEKDNLKLDMTHKNKAYSLSGAYRHVAVRPEHLEWRTVRYNEPFCDLQLSDLQQLKGYTDTGIVEDGKFKACLLTISLPVSSYATMALRELLKVDTSNDHQAQQNNYFKNDSEDKSEKEEDKVESDVKQDVIEHNENVERGEKRKIEDETEVDSKKKKEDNVDS